MTRSANNIDLQIGARVAALNVDDSSWIFPGIITEIAGLTHTIKLDAGNTVTGVISAHLWAIELAKNYPKLYWGYPADFAKILSRFSVPEYFNRSIPVNVFGSQLIQGMYLFLNKAVFGDRIPQPTWIIANRQAAGSANRKNEITVSTRARSLKHLFNTIGHEMVHLFQFKYVPPAKQALEISLGLHGATFFAWREPLAKVGIELTRGDDGDADLEIPQAGKRDKEQILLLSNQGKQWKGGIAGNEKAARQLALQLSEPGRRLSIIKVWGAALMHNMLPITVKGRVRLIDLDQNVIDYIRKYGEALTGYDLP
jgi:hypothetical protein